MIKKRFARFAAYGALIGSCFLSSRANEMTSQYGEQVKEWEPSFVIHFQILFSPIIEWLDYRDCIPISDVPDQIWAEMWANIFYWVPITVTGWLFLVYSALRRWHGLRWMAFGVSVLGLGFLTHHLYERATGYQPYFHFGVGGYFLVSAYFAFAAYLYMDAVEQREH